MTSPRFRADHVGSLLRPGALVEARASLADDQLHGGEALRTVEDPLIAEVAAMQAEVGLPIATDGEFRRSFWHYDFLDLLDGVAIEYRPATDGLKFAGTALRPFYPAITGPIRFPDDHPMLDHFRFLADVSTSVPKISIPGPSTVHFRTAPASIAPPQYVDLDVLFDDIAAAYADAVTAFYAAGVATSNSTTSSSPTCATPTSVRARWPKASIPTNSSCATPRCSTLRSPTVPPT